jgi:alpha-D-ribose 1-methylphosphonate 5-triphosphate synthase subunit PhnI
MYVAVKGGEKAIDNAHSWMSEIRRGDPSVPNVSLNQITEQLTLGVDRVMSEGSLYDKDLAALAIKQSRGDLIEAIFLLRAYRTTLKRFSYSKPIDTANMLCLRRISATFKDIPGGQKLGPTFDYTHRLLDFKLLAENETPLSPTQQFENKKVPHVLSFLNQEDLMQKEKDNNLDPIDITREPISFPTSRAARLQALSRGDEGFLQEIMHL